MTGASFDRAAQALALPLFPIRQHRLGREGYATRWPVTTEASAMPRPRNSSCGQLWQRIVGGFAWNCQPHTLTTMLAHTYPPLPPTPHTYTHTTRTLHKFPAPEIPAPVAEMRVAAIFLPNFYDGKLRSETLLSRASGGLAQPGTRQRAGAAGRPSTPDLTEDWLTEDRGT